MVFFEAFFKISWLFFWQSKFFASISTIFIVITCSWRRSFRFTAGGFRVPFISDANNINTAFEKPKIHPKRRRYTIRRWNFIHTRRRKPVHVETSRRRQTSVSRRTIFRTPCKKKIDLFQYYQNNSYKMEVIRRWRLLLTKNSKKN